MTWIVVRIMAWITASLHLYSIRIGGWVRMRPPKYMGHAARYCWARGMSTIFWVFAPVIEIHLFCAGPDLYIKSGSKLDISGYDSFLE